MTDYVTPSPSFINKKAVEKFAVEIARILDFKPGNDIATIVDRLGGKIVTGSTGIEDIESGSLIARTLNNFTIYLSPFTSLARDQFTIAHELGHLFLHLSQAQANNPDSVMRATRYTAPNNPDAKRAEWEANWFAAAFLMPEEIFKKQYEKGIETAQLYFQLSESAIKTRASSLGLS